MKKNAWKIAAAVILVAIALGLRFSGITDYVTLESVQRESDRLADLVREDLLLWALAFTAFYSVWAAFALPMASVLSIAAGFLFGLMGLFPVLAGATLGATLAFLASRYLVGNIIQQRFGERVERFNRELERHGHRYLLTLRLIPLFPFFLINVGAGLTRISAFTYIWTTALGIIPGAFVFVYAGTRLHQIEKVSDIISPGVLSALILLGLFASIPTIYMKIREKRQAKKSE
jgi:uncharacterized membrane protein YdjX (TVP38/TMEM64 family)